MPDSFGVIDSHLHLWDPARLSYPWLESLPRIHRTFGLEELTEATPGIPLQGFIFVECNTAPGQTLDEVRAVAELAREEPRLLGSVAYADLTNAAELPRLLDAFRELGSVRGVRHNIQGNPPGFCTSSEFVAGVTEVGRRGFTFDLCATHDQLGDVVELARRVPATRLVLDHCGKPDIASGRLDPWRAHISELAALPHVSCKISGLLTEAGVDWTEEKLLPYVDHVVEQFGTDRVMYGGDWPVLTLVGSYLEWYQFTRRFTAEWTPGERAAFYRENALRFYGI
ncbi:MAG TPA: amidohydrolase family protein [Longimicrobiaceae bacterium]